MPSQQQINLAAYKSGKKPEEIQALLQSKQSSTPQTSQGSIMPDQVQAPAGATYAEQNILPPSVTGYGVTPTQNQSINQAQTTAPGQPMPGSVASLLGEGFGAEDPFITQYTQDQLNQYNQVIDETAIRKQKESELQAQIDAINAVYADRLRQEKTKGQGRLGSGRALQARSGLIGSDFGAAQTENISQLNREQEQSVENERLALVNQLLSGAQKSAADEIAAKRLAKEAGGKAYLDYLAGASTRKKEKVSKAAQLLLSLGKSPTDISDEELKQAGISRQDLTMEYTGMKSAQDSAATTAELDQAKKIAEIEKLNADIAKGQLDASKYYEVGNRIYEQGTNRYIGDSAFNPYSGAMQVTPGNQVYNPVTGTFTQAPGGSFSTNAPAGGFRTDRHNNPTAMTTDVARTLGLVEGVDYTKGDPFPNNPNLFTARLNGDPIQTTIKALDTAAKDPNKKAFYTQGGGQRWTYIGLSDEEWLSKTPEEKAQVIATMYKNEGGNGSINAGTFVVGGGAGQTTLSNLSKEAQNIIAQINTQGGKPQDYILGTSKDSQALLQEVLQGLNTQGGSGTLASDTRTQSLELAQNTIEELLKNKDFAGSFQTRRVGDTGLGSVFNLTANENVNFVNRVDALAGQLMQIDGPTLKAIFGPQISNSDIEMIKKTILQGLDPKNQNPEAFEKTLNDVKAKMQAYINRLPKNQSTGITTSNTGSTSPAGGVVNGAI